MALPATQPPLAKWYVFTVVALATFLSGLALWTSHSPQVHVSATIVRHAPIRNDAHGTEYGPVAMSESDVAAFTRLAEAQLAERTSNASEASPSKRLPVEETMRPLTITRRKSGKSTWDSVMIHYVGNDENEALSIVDALSREFVAFMRKRCHQSTSGQRREEGNASYVSRRRVAEAARQLDNFLADHFRSLDQMDKAKTNAKASAKTMVKTMQKPQRNVTPDQNVDSLAQAKLANTEWASLKAEIANIEFEHEKQLTHATVTHPRVQRLAATLFNLKQRMGQLNEQFQAETHDLAIVESGNISSENVDSDYLAPSIASNVEGIDASEKRHPAIMDDEVRKKLGDKRNAEYARLRDNVERARLQYEESLRSEQRARQETFTRSLESVPLFQVEPAHVVGAGSVDHLGRMGGLGFFSVCVGGYCAILIRRRKRNELLWDPIEAKNIVSLPVVGRLVSPLAKTPPSAGQSKSGDRNVRLATRASELVLATFVFAFLITAFSDARLTNQFLADPCRTFTQAISSQGSDST